MVEEITTVLSQLMNVSICVRYLAYVDTSIIIITKKLVT